MISLLYGSDKNKIQKRRDSLILDYKKTHTAHVVNLHNSILDIRRIVQNAHSISFFGETYIYLLNQENIFLNPENDLLQSMQDSQHLFIIELDVALAETQKIYKQIGALGEEYKKAKPIESFNPFLLTDYLWARDKKNMWRQYDSNIKSGEPAEAVQGRILWAMKMLMLFLQNPGKSIEDTGITPFVYQKLQKNKSAFTKYEALDLYRAFLYCGEKGYAVETMLEKIILEKV